MLQKLVLVLVLVVLASALMPVVASAAPADGTNYVVVSGPAFKTTACTGAAIQVAAVRAVKSGSVYKIISGTKLVGWYIPVASARVSSTNPTPAPAVKPQTDGGIGWNVYLFYQGMVNGDWNVGR